MMNGCVYWIESKVGRVLALLAATPHNQIASLPKGVQVADEIALELDHALSQLQPSNPDIPEDVLLELRSIDQELDLMSGEENAHRWTDRALVEDEVWVRIRERARRLATQYGIDLDTPVPFADVKFIQ